MNCPSCTGSQSKVVETRKHSDFILRRRRECLACSHRWNTVEVELDEWNLLQEAAHRVTESVSQAELRDKAAKWDEVSTLLKGFL